MQNAFQFWFGVYNIKSITPKRVSLFWGQSQVNSHHNLGIVKLQNRFYASRLKLASILLIVCSFHTFFFKKLGLNNDLNKRITQCCWEFKNV